MSEQHITAADYQRMISGKKKPSKYRAKATQCQQGHKHDSAFEAQRCDELHFLQKIGKIKDLKLQVSYELVPRQKFTSMNSERACTYKADFVYTTDSGITIIEDTKGFQTKDYIIKRKLMKQLFCNDNTIIFKEIHR